MNAYKVKIQNTGEEVCVVARSMPHASDVLVSFWFFRCGKAPGEFQIETGAPTEYRGHPTVRHAAAGKVAGVIVRQMDGSMLFEPAIA